MPKLASTQSKRPFSVTAKLTADEYARLIETAERLNMKPSAFAREVLLSSTKASPTERLLLAKTCKVEAMVQLLFGGLFAQLNDNTPFEKEHFRQALETAESVQFRKAEEHMMRHVSAVKGAAHA